MTDENNQIDASTAIKELPVDATVASSGAELVQLEVPVSDLNNFNNKNDGFAETNHMENEISSDTIDIQDQWPQTIIELNCQNAYLVAQFHDFKNQVYTSSEILKTTKDLDVGNEDSQQIKLLQEKITISNKEIMLQKETQKAAEKALEHLRVSNSEEDDKVQDLSIKLVEAQQKMAQEIKERDNKYVELDSKFGRLHKRAKQKIQEIQKEKDDLEAQFRDVTVKAEQTSSQQSLVHKELERGRQQAIEALRSMDTERQQLRATNNKLRDDIDEMHRTLEAKQNSLEESRQTIFEKDQILEDTRRLLQVAEDGKQTSMTELSNKYKEELENLEDQIAEVVSERNKAAETISSLQTLIGEKDRKIAELDAASTGEAVRLGSVIEVAKAEISQLKNELENGKKNWEASYNTLKVKIEASESAYLHSEIEAARMRSELELELSRQTQLLNTKDSELKTLKEEISRLESDFSSYKVRAHALLQKKDAELHAAKDNDIINAQEEAIREAEREVAITLEEKDKALQDLQNALNSHDKEITARELALDDAEQRAKSFSLKLNSAKAQYQTEKEAWKKNLDALEENWRLKYSALEVQKNENSGIDLQSKLKDVMQEYKKLKEEHETFRDIADRMLEEKENEISKFLKENNTLRKTSKTGASVNYIGNENKVVLNDDVLNSDIAAEEQQILILARQQAQREDELTQSQRHIMALQEEIVELERENRLHSQQEAMLKEEVRNVERNHKREGVDMTYLKNVILKLLETGEVDALLPVVGTLLQFSPNEMKKCQQTYRALNDASLSSAATPPESLASTTSLFSRFSFT